MTTKKDLRDFIEAEQECLWTDLDRAIRNAANGVWSMAAAGFAMRAAYAARLVGPCHGGVLPWGLHSGGIIDAVLRVAGIEPPTYSAEQWARWEATMGRDYGTVGENIIRHGATVSAIKNDRQLALDLQP